MERNQAIYLFRTTQDNTRHRPYTQSSLVCLSVCDHRTLQRTHSHHVTPQTSRHTSRAAQRSTVLYLYIYYIRYSVARRQHEPQIDKTEIIQAQHSTRPQDIIQVVQKTSSVQQTNYNRRTHTQDASNNDLGIARSNASRECSL